MLRLCDSAITEQTLNRRMRAFTIVEMIVVLVVVGVLAAIVVPRFNGMTDEAKASAVQGILSGIRSSVAGFRSRQVIAGTAAYPTITQLTTLGTVLQQTIPANPYNNFATVQTVSSTQAASRAVLNTNTFGWNYYVDNSSTPPTALFYANSSAATSIPNGTGGFKAVNEL